MKKLICIFMAAALLCPMFVFADNTSVIASYQAQFSETQGTNYFYFCESTSGQVKELIWFPEVYGVKTWAKESASGVYPKNYDYPMVNANYATPGGGADFEYMFVSPRRGTVRLQGEIKRNPNNIIGDSSKGDGVRVSILKNSRELWSGSLPNNQASVSYDINASVKVGDKLHFRINCGQHNFYDATKWWPKVDYISNEYTPDEYDPAYYQKDTAGKLTELEYNESESGYLAGDGRAFISDEAVLATDTYSVIKRFKIPEQGRYRVYSSVESSNTTSFGNIARVYRNGIEIWKQLLVSGQTCTLDIGVFAEKNDTIDVEVGVNGYGGFNRCKWTCDAVKYIGTLFKECDTSVGAAYSVEEENTLSSFIEKGGSNVSISTEKYVKQPMTYSTAEGKYKSAIEGESDYVSKTTVAPGTTTDAVIDIKASKSGALKLSGDLKITGGNSDGVLAKVYINDKLIWSNRVGSERSLRWDDRFDEVYFLNNINAVANVKAGDIISFKFNKWRSTGGDNVDISDVKLSYISGDVLSDTTKWKLENSTVIDTETGLMHKDGINSGAVNVSVKNGVAYIAKADIDKIFGDKADVVSAACTGDEIRVRDAASAAGMAVSWTADRMIILYDGISVFFGYPEASEIRTRLEMGGDLFE